MPEGFPIENDKPEGCDGMGGGNGAGLHQGKFLQQPTNKSFVAKGPEAVVKKAKKQQPTDLDVLAYAGVV